MYAIMGWLVIGLVAGGVARLLVPGRQRMGLLMTLVLGLVGSILGGMISTVVFDVRPDDSVIDTGGLLMSTVGAVIVLAVYSAYLQRGQRRLT